MNPSILLARHGETEWNRDGRLQGREDSPLTPRGLAQADALAAAAKSLRVRRIIASPLGRALTTARVVAEACGASLEISDALVELSFGACAGLTMAEIESRHPALRAAREAARWTTAWPEGGESYADAEARVRVWLESAGLPWSDPPAAIVGHGASSRSIARALTGMSTDAALAIALPSGGAVRLWPSGSWQAVELGDATAGLEREV